MTERIQEFLRNRRSEGQDTEPCLVVDLEVVRDNYQTFAKALPDSRVFYAVKANPSPEVLQLLASMGSCFDTATVAEIEMALAAGATPDRISYGNTIKKERDIARAFALGIRLFAVDCTAEVEKIARAAPAPRCSAAFSMIAQAPNGRCRASSVAIRRWRSTCSTSPSA
jgi:ornithine decarboxylase